MSRVLSIAGVLLLGLVLGYLLRGLVGVGDAEPPPDDWVARVGDEYVTRGDWESEIRMRVGTRPGLFESAEQRQALMDQLLYRRALVERAEETDIDDRPEVRRSLDQILINQLLQAELRPRQESADITPEQIEAFYAEHADEYTVPARRRVAMIHFELGAGASEETRDQVRATAEAVLDQAQALPESMPGFGNLAREHSAHQASRYRGGVLGWVGEGDPARYSHPQVVVETVNAMTEEGAFSDIVEDDDGLYLVRLVDYEPQRTRPLEELSDGIRQRLLRERFRNVERDFREEVLAAASIEVNARGRELLEATGEPVREPETPRPPSRPGSGSEGN